jgi:arsenical-resistance protein 2
MLEANQKPGVDLLLVDVRNIDHQVKNFNNLLPKGTCGRSLLILMQGLTISGSLNMPIQTLQPSLATLYRFCTTARIKKVIFYCGERHPSRR